MHLYDKSKIPNISNGYVGSAMLKIGKIWTDTGKKGMN